MAFLPHRISAENTNSIRHQVSMLHQFRGDNELGDANKFRGVVGKKGYLLTVDDDISYPPDYVDYMIGKIEQYNREAVITCHGKILKDPPIDSFYEGGFIKFRCLDTVEQDVPVHIPGTGVMGWHSDTIQFAMDDFPKPNMADIWAGIKCESQGVPRVCVAHEKGWIKSINSDDTTLWKQNKKRDDVLTDTINSIEWKPLLNRTYGS